MIINEKDIKDIFYCYYDYDGNMVMKTVYKSDIDSLTVNFIGRDTYPKECVTYDDFLVYKNEGNVVGIMVFCVSEINNSIFDKLLSNDVPKDFVKEVRKFLMIKDNE